MLWFVAAALAAGGAVLASRAHLASLEANRPDVGPPVEVVVAASHVQRGDVVATSTFRAVDIPSTLVPPGAVTSVDDVLGRVLATDLAAGETLTATRLAGAGGGPVAALVPPGLRAFVLASGPPSGTVRAGDHVDVLATYGANAGRPYTETVATSIEVLDVVTTDLPVTSGPNGAPTGPPIVVLADPATVERLARASSLALLTLAILGEEPEPTTDTFTETATALGTEPIAP